jgi:hypothetical protein
MNPGTIVEGYDLDVVSQTPITYAEVVPPFLEVYPGQQGTASVVFSPPSGPQAQGGQIAFGVRARSRVDPTASGVVEGDLEIGRVFGLQAKLTPVTSSGRWRGRHTVAVANWGNAPARLRLVPSDPDQLLGFLIRPEVVEVPLGTTATARLKVRTRKPVLRGTPTRLPFQVVGEPDPPAPVPGPVSPFSDPSRPVVDGAFMQKPILSRVVVAVAAIAALLLIAGTAFALTRPGSTESQEASGAPEPPANIEAIKRGAAFITLAWDAATDVDKYQLITQQNDRNVGTTDVDGALDQFTVADLKPTTDYCFVMIAYRGSLHSGNSQQVCASTAKATSTATPPPPPDGTQTTQTSTGGTESTATTSTTTSTTSTTSTTGNNPPPVFTPGQYVNAVRLYPAASSTAEQSANSFKRQLQNNGIDAKVLFTGDYDGLLVGTLHPEPSYMVYVGPYGSFNEALADCGSITPAVPGAECNPAQPVPAPPSS